MQIRYKEINSPSKLNIRMLSIIFDLAWKNTRVTTRRNTTQHEATRHNTSKTQRSTRQHETTRVQHETTQEQHETIRVQNNIKFILIYLFHRCILASREIRLYSSVYVVKLRKLRISFSSNSQNRTRKSEGSGLLQLCCNFLSYCLLK